MEIQLKIEQNTNKMKALIKNNDGTKIIKEINSDDFINKLKSFDSIFDSGLLPIIKNTPSLLCIKKYNSNSQYFLFFPEQEYILKYSYDHSSNNYENIKVKYPNIILKIEASNEKIIDMYCYQCYNFDYFHPLESKLYKLQRPNIFDNGRFCFGEIDEERILNSATLPYIFNNVYSYLWNSIANDDLLPYSEIKKYYNDKYHEEENDNNFNEEDIFIEYLKENNKVFDEKYAEQINDICTLGDLIK